jgi:hypothetical protein
MSKAALNSNKTIFLLSVYLSQLSAICVSGYILNALPNKHVENLLLIGLL